MPRPPCLLPALLMAAATASCGQAATEAECIEIIARIARLELTEAGTMSAVEIEREVAGAKEEFAGRARRECVGRRIARGALACVRTAKTAKEIVETCLD